MSLFLFLLLVDEDIAVEEAAVDDAADDDAAVDAADEDAAVDAADDGAFDELDDLICLTLAERVCLREAEVDDDAELFA